MAARPATAASGAQSVAAAIVIARRVNRAGAEAIGIEEPCCAFN
jgi:hypothetical protein